MPTAARRQISSWSPRKPITLFNVLNRSGRPRSPILPSGALSADHSGHRAPRKWRSSVRARHRSRRRSGQHACDQPGDVVTTRRCVAPNALIRRRDARMKKHAFTASPNRSMSTISVIGAPQSTSALDGAHAFAGNELHGHLELDPGMRDLWSVWFLRRLSGGGPSEFRDHGVA
jgi:hypothetical protein